MSEQLELPTSNQSTSSSEDSPVQKSVGPTTHGATHKKQGWQGRTPAFGGICTGSFAKYNPPGGWSSRTYQHSLLEDSGQSSETSWPLAGHIDTSSGIAYRRYPSGRGIDVIESSSSPTMLPTPCARDWKDNNSPAEQRRNTPPLATHAGGKLNPEWIEALMGFPIGFTE